MIDYIVEQELQGGLQHRWEEQDDLRINRLVIIDGDQYGQ